LRPASRVTVLRGGNVLDGTGRRPAYVADVVIIGDSIVDVGRIAPIEGAETIDVSGRYVAPGFIDIHSHSDFTLLRDPRAVSQITQGVTTEVIGNCGFGCCPICDASLAREAIYGYDESVDITWRDLDGYFSVLEKAKPSVNVAALIPNGQLRLSVLGTASRPARVEEVGRMARLLRDGLEQGAIGYSTGLEYPWESPAPEEEISTLCAVAAEFGGLYATHTRNRDDKAIAAIDEAIRIARRTDVRLQISHISPRRGMDDTLRALDRVDKARAVGQDVAFDMHTRCFGTTGLKVLLPAWALAGGREALAARLRDPGERERMRAYISLISAIGDWARVVLYDSPSHPHLARLDFETIGRQIGRDPHVCAFDILLGDIDHLHRPMVLLLTYDEEILRETFRHPACAIGSDATALAPDGPLAGSVFHGAYSWASWFFRRMVRETLTFSPQEGVHKLTAKAAERIGLLDRGTIRAGSRADIAVFDPVEFGETATTFDPNKIARGMIHVMVNGRFAMQEGALTGNRSGRILRARGYGVSDGFI
jgi:N-acyl-D-amino-acid deacylase